MAALKRYRLLLLLGVAGILLWLNLSAPQSAAVVDIAPRSPATAAQTNAAPVAQWALTPSQPASSPEAAASAVPQSLMGTVPAYLSRAPLESAVRDPFAPEAPKPMAVVKQPPPVPVVVAPPPSPEPPPLNLVYTGRLSAPDGSLVVYATQGDNPIVLTPGLALPNGYRVDAITATAVEFSFPAMNRTARLDLPAPQKYQTR